jgi:hypothetical protein
MKTLGHHLTRRANASVIRVIMALGLLTTGHMVLAADEIIFFPDMTYRSIAIPDPSCSFIIDLTVNYSITKLDTAIDVKALGVDTTGALLIVMCPNKVDSEYVLSFQNISSQSDLAPELNAVVPADAYFESSVSRTYSGQTTLTNRLVDRTYKPVQFQLEHGQDPFDRNRHLRSFDVTHTLSDDSLVYYGRSFGFSGSTVLENNRGGFEA